ncbi:MAG: hypothetical protein J6112_06180, partial [Clostridia bacterium]|nr:hypothetical protein [Clostridia bacterium]
MNTKKTIALVCIVLAIMIVTPVVFAWLSDTLTNNANIESYVHKSYFESGDGTGVYQYNEYYTTENNVDIPYHGLDGNGNELTEETGCAFEIKYPVQLYYFAWLQYLGYFNRPAEGSDDTIDQVYFYLSADLDMTGWVLPPVGTSDYPFVGNFDGNGHTISNLTIQNVNTGTGGSSSTNLTDIPVDNISGAEIIGFFGVVGSLESDGTV